MGKPKSGIVGVILPISPAHDAYLQYGDELWVERYEIAWVLSSHHLGENRSVSLFLILLFLSLFLLLYLSDQSIFSDLGKVSRAHCSSFYWRIARPVHSFFPFTLFYLFEIFSIS